MAEHEAHFSGNLVTDDSGTKATHFRLFGIAPEIWEKLAYPVVRVDEHLVIKRYSCDGFIIDFYGERRRRERPSAD